MTMTSTSTCVMKMKAPNERRTGKKMKLVTRSSQHEANNTSDNTGKQISCLRSSKTTRNKRKMTTTTTTNQALFALISLTFSLTLQVNSAVVRPTIFSGLNGPDAAQVSSSSPPTVASVREQASPQAQQQQQTEHNQMMSSTKITPFKSRFCQALNGAKLDSPLGLQSMAIDDLALSASSYSNEQVGPHLARLNLDNSGGAWCPGKPISNSNFGKEWIQVKLNRSYVVSAIETQGRYGQGNGKEFVPSYQIEYSRNGGRTWHKWKDFRGSNLLRANEDVNNAVKNELSPPIVGANVIRILPYSKHLQTVCLRFELHGCFYDEGAPMAYATSDGVVEPRWGHLIDYTYDGLRQAGQLSQGLGQLVDGVKGPDNFSQNLGFEWVGWKSMNGDVVIEFSFKTVRNFTGALFHSNNLFSQGVEVFQSVDVHYGLDVPLAMEALKDAHREQARRDSQLLTQSAPAQHRHRRQQESLLPLDAYLGKDFTESASGAGFLPDLGDQQRQPTLWSSDVLSIEYEPDKRVQSSRPVTVHLKQRLANKLRFHLKFASKWILLSEVEFLSHPVELLALPNNPTPSSNLNLALNQRAGEQQQQVALLQSLAAAKSYDEFVAIVREHQLRRIATNAFLESVVTSSSAFGSDFSVSTQSLDTSDSPASAQQDLDLVKPPNVWQQGIAGNGNSNNQLPTNAAENSGPSTNPGLIDMFGFAQNSPNNFLGQPPATQMADQPNQPKVQLTQVPQSPVDQVPSVGEAQTGARVGLASLASFVLVTVLVILAILFVVSSYRMRHQPKLAHQVGSLHPRHLVAGGTTKSGMSPNLHTFISALQSVNAQSNQAAAAMNQQHHQSIYGDNLYGDNSRQAALFGGLQQPASTMDARTSGIKRAAGQLLVSVKERPGKMLFGGGGGGSGNQTTGNKRSQNGAVNTQLIVGLNQANPFAHQQVYSQNQVSYAAANYSGISSMASSSTTTGIQGDYADYAIPDAQQPMIPARQHQINTNLHLNQAFNPSSNSQQQQQQWTTSANVNKPFGFQSELRSSQHRAPIEPQIINFQRNLNPQSHNLTAASAAEHNYELISQENGNTCGGTLSARQTIHQRTLSGGCQANNQQGFNSFTLGRPAGNLMGPPQASSRQQRGQIIVNPVEECSPGGGSSASGATTATTSANSSEMSHYYYQATTDNTRQ